MYVSERTLHIGGYHGTDLGSAEQIAAEGFQITNGDIFFAPLDNLNFAQSHGVRRARDRAEAEYGVVQAMFPGKELEFGLGGDQIVVPVREIGRITIVGLRIYSVEQSRLLLSKSRQELES